MYLDTSDYAFLYQPPTTEAAALRDEVLHLKRSAKVKFCFSLWTLFEFLQPPAVGYEEERSRRARFFSGVVEDNALPDIQDVLASRKPIPAIWLPQAPIARLAETLADKLVERIEEHSSLTRVQRRAMRTRAGRRNLFAGLTGDARNFEATMAPEGGLTPAFVRSRALSRFMLGECDESEFATALMRMFCEPEFFYQKWFLEEGQANPIVDLVRKHAASITGSMSRFRDATREVKEARAAALAAGARARASRKSFLESLTPEQAAKMAAVLPLPAQVPKFEMPAFDGILANPRLRYVSCYIAHRGATPGEKANDIIDIMHLFYTPDVDLIRCDGPTFEAFRRCPYLPNHRLVQRLQHLPARARELASTT